MRDEKPRILIAVASGRGWAADFGVSLAGMMAHLAVLGERGLIGHAELSVAKQAYLVKARNDALLDAIKRDFTHILYLDDDMSFPGNIIDSLLAADKPVITCNYRKKDPNTYKFVCTDLLDNEVSSLYRRGVEQIGACGMGLTLVRIDAVRLMRPPFFAVLWQSDIGEFLIEDGFFCKYVGEHRVTIWVDHDASRLVGHVGESCYRIPPFVDGAEIIKKAVDYSKIPRLNLTEDELRAASGAPPAEERAA